MDIADLCRKIASRYQIHQCRLFIALICVFVSLSVHGDSNPFLTSNLTESHESLIPYSTYLADPSGELSISELNANSTFEKFLTIPSDTTRFDQSAGSYWLKFSIKNDGKEHTKLWLEIDKNRLDEINFYRIDNEKNAIQKSGSTYSNPNWSNQERLNLLRISLEPFETGVFLLHIKSKTAVNFTPKIYSDHSQITLFDSRSQQLGMLYGVLFALVVYALNLYISLRRRMFLYFVVWLTSTGCFIAASQGTIKTLLSAPPHVVNEIYALSIVFSFLANALFLRQFLQLPQTTPKLDRAFCGICIVPLLLYIAPLSINQFEFNIVIVGVVATIAGIYISLYRLMNGYSPAKYALVSYAFIFVPFIFFQVIPASIAREYTGADIFNFSAMLQMLVIASGLGFSIDLLVKQLNSEIIIRKKREHQLTEAQLIAQYGDWSWNIKTQEFSISDSALAILPNNDTTTISSFEQILSNAEPSERISVIQALKKSIAAKSRFQQDFSLKFSDGSIRHFSCNADFQLEAIGERSDLLIGALHDITDKKNADLAFSENQQRWRDLADSTFEAILIFQDRIIIDANQACEDLLGYGPADLIGTRGELFIDEETLSRFFEPAPSHKQGTKEFTIQHKNNPEITLEFRSKRGKFSNQDVNIVAIRDVSERKRYERQLRKLGYYDSLTGLANRSLFLQRVQHAVEKSHRTGEKHALLFLDLDQFKFINDSLGHHVGDSLLRKVGERLKQRARKTDTVARLGGDEFAILLEDITAPYAAAKLAEKILTAMALPIDIDDYPLTVTPSIGIALFPSDGRNSSELLRKADTAMYHAKDEGRNNYQFYTEELNDRITRRMDLESELRFAMERGELYLQYQPKVELNNGHIVGAEALLRWNSQRFGMISPDEFIPIAEETGLIWPIGKFVLETACQQAKIWIDQNQQFSGIAVNISGVQFSHYNLVDSVTQVIDSSGLPAHCLELEITEGAIIGNAEEAIKIMKQLKAVGVNLSLDDFGTGYSSLSYLKRFPVDSLKIDRSFVAEIVADVMGRKIAMAIVQLAHDLCLNVVAEGVESEEQMLLIKQMGCDELQGYIFSPPLHNQDLTTMLAETRHLS